MTTAITDEKDADDAVDDVVATMVSTDYQHVRIIISMKSPILIIQNANYTAYSKSAASICTYSSTFF